MTSEGDAGRTYTVQEADALLPDLRASLERIRRSRQAVLAGGRQLRRTAGRNGGGDPGHDYRQALATLRHEVEQMNERNIILRDPEEGLLDIPSVRDGEAVYLCWRQDEPRVAFWHGPSSGFLGRKPV